MSAIGNGDSSRPPMWPAGEIISPRSRQLAREANVILDFGCRHLSVQHESADAGQFGNRHVGCDGMMHGAPPNLAGSHVVVAAEFSTLWDYPDLPASRSGDRQSDPSASPPWH
jgi:hypothetical protein